jgi:hypothetical protein
MKNIHMQHIALAGQITPTTNFRQLRKIFGLAISLIGLSASIASAATITVQDPGFETPGVSLGGPWAEMDAVWNPTMTYAQTDDTSRFASRPDAGTWYGNFTDPGNTITQDLLTSVSVGDTLSVTFYVGRENGQAGGVLAASFLVGATAYTTNIDTTSLAAGTWAAYTFTATIANAGNLSLKFNNVSGRPWLDAISDVTQTPGVFVNHPPTSSGGSVLMRTNTVKTFAAADFNFSDVDLGQTLQAVKVTSTPLHGTLSVAVDTEILVADIGTLTYTPNSDHSGSDSFNFKVSDGTDYSVADATMAITVTTGIPVQNGSFETGSGLTPDSWTPLTTWTFQAPDRGRVTIAGGGGFPSATDGGSYYLRYSWNDSGVVQDLNTTVLAGDTLSVTCALGKDNNFSGGDVTGNAFFKVGTTYYYMPYDLSSLANGTWSNYTFTTTIANSGDLSVGFRVAFGTANNQYACLDNVSSVTETPGVFVNHPPTSSGGSVILSLPAGPSKTFAATDFQFSDVDPGQTLQAVKVTSLPAHGTLSVPVNTEIPVGDIGTLTYTPNTGYTGPDSFNFKVSDGTDYSVADAAMTITVTTDILVINGGFEDPTPHNPNNGTNPDWTAGGWAFVGAPWTASTANYGRLSQGPVASPQLGNWMVNLNDSGGWVKQDLQTTVNAGDTLSVTFYVMSDTAPGQIAASFLVGDGPTEYSQTFDNPQNSGTWVPYTLTQTIADSGNLSLQLSQVSGRVWLDNVSNVSVVTMPPATPVGLAAVPGDASVVLTWTASPTATGYNVWSSNSVTSTVQIDATDASPYTKTGLDNGTLYYFAVSATNLLGESAYSAEVSATPAAVLSSAKDFIAFSLLGHVGTISGTNISITVPFGTNPNGLTPTYTVSPLASALPLATTPVDFTTPQTYTVTAQDLTTKDYLVTVTVAPPPVVSPSALIGHWISGPASLSDTSGYTPAGTHDGVAVGANAAALAWSSDVPAGFTGQSLNLTANNVGVLITNTAVNDANYRTTFDEGISNKFTAAFWFKAPAASLVGTWVGKSGNTPYGWKTRPIFTPVKADFTMRNNGIGETGVPSAIQSTNAVDDGNWHHMAAVFDGRSSFRKIYVDGVLQAHVTGTPYSVTFTNVSHLLLGANQGNTVDAVIGSFFPGLLYDVRMYSYPLTVTEVANLHTPGPDILSITGPVAGKFTISASANGAGNVVTWKATDLGLSDWTPIQTNAVVGGAFNITIPQGADPKAFYRLSQ